MGESSSGPDPLDGLAHEFAERHRRGERPSVAEYAEKYPALAEQIRELFPALAVMEQLGGADGASTGPYVPPAADVPDRLGDYRILRQVGRGGMGIVYEAVQESLGRHVALKVLPYAGGGRPDHLARFRREAKAAAALHHTNIVSVFGVGEVDGVHYYAMQFIHGQGLDAVLDEVRRLRAGEAPPDPASTRTHMSAVLAASLADGSPVPPPAAEPPAPSTVSGGSHLSGSEAGYYRSAARLAAQAAEALDYAHRQGVVHRDVKPSNLLLDTHGTLWVTDFGLAKVEGSADLTGTGDVIGTLRYMAPERFRGEADSRSDVYSLGLTLYEMLTLRPAFQAAEKAQLIERLLHTDPPRPRSLDPLVPRELDWIVMKALEKDRDRRYETAGGFARDIQRYLADEPVLAGPPSVGYRLGKFLRRNRGSSLAAAVVLVALVAGIVGTSLALLEARRQEKAAFNSAQEEKKAHTAAVESEGDTRAFAEFLANHVLAATRPAGVQHGVGRNVTMEEALVQAEGKIDEVFRGRPRAEAMARHEIGVTWRNLGKYEAAERQLRRALELRTQLFGAEAPDTLECLISLGVTLNQAGRSAEAIALHERALKACEAAEGRSHPRTLTTINNLAGAYRDSGQYQRALALLEEALDHHRANPDARLSDSLPARLNLADVYQRVGSRRRAVALLEETQTLLTATFPPDDTITLITRANLAMSHLSEGEFDRALAMLEEVAPKIEAALGPDHPDTLDGRNNLGVAYHAVGQIERARSLFEATLDEQKKVLGPEHPSTLRSMANLGEVYFALGQIGRAETLHAQALDLRKQRLGPDHPVTLNSITMLGSTLVSAGKANQAIPILEEALTKQKDALGPTHSWTLETLIVLSHAHANSGKLDQAVPMVEEALDKGRPVLGSNHPVMLRGLNNLATYLGDLGKIDRARLLLEESLKRNTEAFGPDHPRTLYARSNLGAHYRNIGRTDEALPLLEDALAKMSKTIGRSHHDALLTMNNLAMAYWDKGKLDRTIPLLEETYKNAKEALGPNDMLTLVAMSNLADCYLEVRQTGRAMPLLQEALERSLKHLGPTHPRTLGARNLLALGFARDGQFDQAIPLLEETLVLHRKMRPNDHPDVLLVQHNLGVILMDAGQLDRALPLLETSAGLTRKAFGMQHRRARAFVLALCDCHDRMKNPAAAEPYRRELADLARKETGATSLPYAGAMTVLGMNLIAQQKFADAEPVLREGLAIREKQEPQAWTTFNSRSVLGGALLGQKKYDEAEPLLVSGYEGMEKREAQIPPPGKPRLPEALERLVQLYVETGKTDEAKRWRAKLEDRKKSSGKK